MNNFNWLQPGILRLFAGLAYNLNVYLEENFPCAQVADWVLDLELDAFKEHHPSSDVLEVINYIYSQGTKLMKELNEELVKDLLSNLFYLSDLLNLDREEIYKTLSYKQDKVEERLNSDY